MTTNDRNKKVIVAITEAIAIATAKARALSPMKTANKDNAAVDIRAIDTLMRSHRDAILTATTPIRIVTELVTNFRATLSSVGSDIACECIMNRLNSDASLRDPEPPAPPEVDVFAESSLPFVPPIKRIPPLTSDENADVADMSTFGMGAGVGSFGEDDIRVPDATGIPSGTIGIPLYQRQPGQEPVEDEDVDVAMYRGTQPGNTVATLTYSLLDQTSALGFAIHLGALKHAGMSDTAIHDLVDEIIRVVAAQRRTLPS